MMRSILTLTLLLVLLSPCAAQVDFQGRNGTMRVDNGGRVQIENWRGSQVGFPLLEGPGGASLNPAPLQSETVTIERAATGEYIIHNRGSRVRATVDLRPGGLTQVETRSGNYTVPTTAVRQILQGADPHAARLFDSLR